MKNTLILFAFTAIVLTTSAQDNKAFMKSIGKKSFFSLGYSIPMGDSKNSFTPPANYNELAAFLNGHSGGLDAKYALSASMGDVIINLYTSEQWKISLDWNVIDAEYVVFDWSGNTFVKQDDPNGQTIEELRSVKGGTRIGPSFTYLLSKKVALSAYYAARPGVQFLLDDLRINPTSTTSFTVEQEYNNHNFSSEVGLKFHFFNSFTVNPYLHFGKFNWKNTIESLNGTPASQEVQANYPFTLLGIRLGVL